jgi:hypothetical protein
MSTAEPEFARDRWCWPRPDEDPNEESKVVVVEVPARGEVDEENVCRICLDEAEPLIQSPCRCTGTQSWVHTVCLRRWRMSAAGRRLLECEVCRGQYTDTVALVYNENNESGEDSDAAAIRCHMNIAWTILLVSQATSLTAVSILILMPENAAPADPEKSEWVSMVSVGSVLNVGLLFYVLAWEKRIRGTLLLFMFLQLFLIMWEYSEFVHGVSNLGCGVVLAGVLSNRIRDNRNDDNDDSDD